MVYWVNANYGGSLLNTLKLPTSPWEICKKCSNGYGCYFLKCYCCNLWLVNVQSFKNSHNCTSTLTLTKANAIFQFGSSKMTTHKVHINNASSKNSKSICFGTKKLKNKEKL